MSAKHTPGPWGFTTLNGCPAVGIDTERGGIICDFSAGDFPESSAANARLIAEAPAMRELLERFSQWRQTQEFGIGQKDGGKRHINGLVDEARTLLARIEGES